MQDAINRYCFDDDDDSFDDVQKRKSKQYISRDSHVMDKL